MSNTNKNQRRKIITSEGRAIIANVVHYLREEYRFMKEFNYDNCDLSILQNINKRTAKATGVSPRSVTKILQEEKLLPLPTSEFPAPFKKIQPRLRKTDMKAKKADIIKIIEEYHNEYNKLPNVTTIHRNLKEKTAFVGCFNTVYRMLNLMGFNPNKGKIQFPPEKTEEDEETSKMDFVPSDAMPIEFVNIESPDL